MFFFAGGIRRATRSIFSHSSYTLLSMRTTNGTDGPTNRPTVTSLIALHPIIEWPSAIQVTWRAKMMAADRAEPAQTHRRRRQQSDIIPPLRRTTGSRNSSNPQIRQNPSMMGNFCKAVPTRRTLPMSWSQFPMSIRYVNYYVHSRN